MFLGCRREGKTRSEVGFSAPLRGAVHPAVAHEVGCCKLVEQALTLPAHFARSRENAGQVSERCLGDMLMRCVRSALVPWA
jgi:hypothetical protein